MKATDTQNRTTTVLTLAALALPGRRFAGREARSSLLEELATVTVRT